MEWGKGGSYFLLIFCYQLAEVQILVDEYMKHQLTTFVKYRLGNYNNVYLTGNIIRIL